MSWAASTTHAMQQIPPPQVPGGVPDVPATPTVIPMLPTRVQQPGRYAPLPDAVAIRPRPVPTTSPPFDDEANDEGNGAVTHAGHDRTGWDGATPDSRARDSGAAGSAASQPDRPDRGESQ